jgi:hypothetical protein
MWCGGAPGYFPRPPTPPTLSSPFPFSGRHNTNQQHTTSMGGHAAWDSNPADLAVVSEECRSSFHHPYRQPLLDMHTHPRPGGGSFLRKNPPSSVGFEPTSAGTATSEHCLRQPCGHRTTSYNIRFWIHGWTN